MQGTRGCDSVGTQVVAVMAVALVTIVLLVAVVVVVMVVAVGAVINLVVFCCDAFSIMICKQSVLEITMYVRSGN